MPINGMTRAAHALHYYERRQEVVANNLANADTDGFKAERVFAQMVEGAIPVANTETDLTAGTLKQTGGKLDLALGGPGFFVMQTADGEQLTRGGSFQLDADGRMVDANGNAILGEGGEIVLPPGQVVIDDSGIVRVDGQEIDRLRIERVPEGTDLTHAGANLFLPDPGRESVPLADRTVRQGYVETSNVSTIESLVDMISIQRAYSAVQKTVTTLDSIRQTISNDLGKPV
ncbi:MAG TPA: flagellar hook-basal body protein [Longimicrobiaceae bacterium]|nr:flagellar hook-basal body protein [Longimicrobiaceae bacterium]